MIHAHYLTTGYLVGSVTKAPVVISTYGFDATLIPRRRMWRKAIRDTSRRYSAVLAEGPAMRRKLLDLGFPENRVIIVPIAAGLQDIDYRDPPPPAGPLRLLVCGRMVEKKGHELAIAAFSQLAPRIPPGSRLTLIGGGPLEASLRAMVGRLGLGSAVEFQGPRRRSEYLEILRTADLLLAPSRTAANGDGEGGAPTAILDAQATGVVVVGSRHADIPFLLADGDTGFLADEDSVPALVEAIGRALDHASDWPKIARRARGQVEVRHSDGNVAQILADIHRAAALS